METTVWKEKCIGNKLNIYTSIQCVVSRGLTLGKMGILQSRDCTQWGIHSHLLLKWSQNNKQFWVDSFITQIVPIHHLVYTGRSSWATSCLTKLISTTTIFKQFYVQKATSWSCETEKGLRDSAPTQLLFRYYNGWGAERDCYVPTYCWVGLDYGQVRSELTELMPLLVMDRRYWSVRYRIGHGWARSQRDL